MSRRSIGSLFGDDVFISYRRSEAADYALALASELTRQNLSCFVDQWGTPPSEELPASLKSALRRCSLLVVVGTVGAMASEPVRKEIEEFEKTGRPIIPIAFRGPDDPDEVSLERASWYPSVRGIAMTVETTAALTAARPSSSVVSRVVNAEGYTRRNLRLRRIALALLVAILALLAAAAIIGKKLWDQTERAGVRLRDTVRQTNLVRRELSQAQQGLIAAQATTKDAQEKTEEAILRQQQAEALERRALEQQNMAERQARGARAERLVTAAESVAAEHPQRSLAFAFAAIQTLREARDPRNPAAEQALRHALVRSGGWILKHESSVEAFAFNSQWLAIGTLEGWIHIWRLTVNGPVAKPAPLQGGWNIKQLLLSVDGRWLCMLSREDVSDFVSLWDLSSVPPKEFSLADDPLFSLFSRVEGLYMPPDGRRVVIVGSLYGNPIVLFWDLPDSGIITAPRLIYNEASFGLEKHSSSSNSSPSDKERASLSMDARWLEVYRSLKGDAVLLNLTSIDPRAKPIPLIGFSSWYQPFAVSNDRRWLVSLRSPYPGLSDSDTVASLWDLQDSAAGPRFFKGVDPLTTFAFSPDCHWLAMISSSGAVKLWNLEMPRSGGGDATITLNESGKVKHMTFSSDSRMLATAGLNPAGKPEEVVRLWNLKVVHSGAQPDILTGHQGEIKRLEFSPDGRWLAATGPPAASLWELEGASPKAASNPIRLQGNELNIGDQSGFSPDGRWFLTAGRYESVGRLWDLAARRWSAAPRQLVGAENLRGQILTKDRRWLLAKDPSDQLLLWSIENWKAPPKALGHYPDIWPRSGATDVSVDGHWLVVAHNESLLLWDLRDGETKPRALNGNMGTISNAFFTSTNGVVAFDQYGSWSWDLTAGAQDNAKYWGKVVDGHRITYSLLEPTDEPPPPPIELPEPETGSRDFEVPSQDEQWTIVVNSDGVHLFPNRLEDLVKIAIEAGVRSLTHEEWEEYFPGLPYQELVKVH